MPCEALQTRSCRHESVWRGRPCSGPVRSGIRELVGPDSGRPGGCRCKGLSPERRWQCRLGCGTDHVRWCRRCSGGSRLPRQLHGHCRGGRSRRSFTDHPWDDAGILRPVQSERPRAGAESLHAAAKRYDGAGQLRPVWMPRTDTAATAHPGDGVAKRATDRCGQTLDRAGWEVRPLVPPGWPCGATQALGHHVLEHEADEQGEEMHEPLGQMRGRVWADPMRLGRTGAAPICIGRRGVGRSCEWIAHHGGLDTELPFLAGCITRTAYTRTDGIRQYK
jgi:hypothetical protein